MDIIKLARKELYEQIWSVPAVKLTAKYGFSDIWLAIIFKENNIPRPSRGYWARVQSGQRVPRTPIPKDNDNRVIEIRTHDRATHGEKAP